MRRSDKEITDIEELSALLVNEKVCRIAINDEKYPHIVPVHFFYDNNKIFIHSASEGKKIDLISKNPNISFEIDIFDGIKGGESPCSYSTIYRSVVGKGQARIISDKKLMNFALRSIIEKYANRLIDKEKSLAFDMVTIIEITIESITGKKSK